MQNQPIHNCCMISRRRAEPMVGSVKPTETWLLLQYNGPMGAQALADSQIPERVKFKFDEALNVIPAARVLLISSRAIDGGSIRFVVVKGREIDPYYVTFDLESYDELLGIDLPDLVGNGSTQGGEIADRFFHLVCTNGRRDPCCAQNGLPLFKALQEIAPDDVWQCSHVGGHRFAATVLNFPHGVFYGRVKPDEARDLLTSGENGDLLIDRYRGRACYEKHVQAAEAHLRRLTGMLGMEDFLLGGVEVLKENSWKITFKEARGETRHFLSITRVQSESVEYVSCRDDKQSPSVAYRLRHHEVI